MNPGKNARAKWIPTAFNGHKRFGVLHMHHKVRDIYLDILEVATFC
jgi:hypothetical protein